MPKLKFTKIQLHLLLMILFLGETSTNNETTQRLFPWENGKPIEDLTETQLHEILEEFLSEDIVLNKTSEICVRTPDPSAFDICIPKPFPQVTEDVRDLLVRCSSRNLSLFKEFTKRNKYNIENIHLAIFSKCLNVLFDIIIGDNLNDLLHFVLSLMKPFTDYETRLFEHFLFRYVSYVKRNKITVTVTDRRFIFKAWNPLHTNISGFFITSEQSYTEFKSIDQFTGKGLAVYIPFGFLHHITANKKIDFHVIIFLILPVRFLRTPSDYDYQLTVDIPEMCVKRKDPIIGIALDCDIRELKLDELDLYGCAASFCQHQEMLPINVNQIFYSLRATCPRTIVNNNYSTIIWPQTPMDRYLRFHPENLCMDGPLHLPSRLCTFSKIEYRDVSDRTRCFDEISSDTKRIYELLKCCWSMEEYCSIIHDIHVDTTQRYIDVYLLLQMYIIETMDRASTLYNIPEIVDSGLEHLTKETPSFCASKLQCLSVILGILVYSITSETVSVQNFEQKNLIVTKHRLVPSINFILRKMQYPNRTGHHYQMLTDENGDYRTDTNTETVVRISHDSLYVDKLIIIGFIIPTRILTRNMPFICRTKLVFLNLKITATNILINCSVYLNTIDDTSNIFSNDEYWFNFEIKSQYISLFCISEPEGNVCNDNKKISIFEANIENLIYNDISKLTVTSLDILSQLTTSMNPDSKQASAEHRKVFKIITYIGCGLSLIGIFFILTSAAVLKKWFSQRYNITQLSITLALENIFLLLDHKSLKHIGYLIFFYIILAQFTWMLLIGYHQYQKFIKVFDAARLDMKKSLMLGWLTPALIILIPSVLYKECFECNLCYRNQEIFNYFVLVPICCVLVINLLVYIGVIYNVSKEKGAETNPEMKRAKIQALILFPFLLGLSWISILILFMPSVWMSLSGSYVFHIVTSSQGFVLFIFTVFLDEHTKKLWRNKWEVLFKKGSRS